MGRHGGGSRSGGSGSSHSSHGGGSRSGGSGRPATITSTKPFSGSFNRTYYDRQGRRHLYYTNDQTVGTEPGWGIPVYFALIVTAIMFLSFFLPVLFQAIEFGSKVNGREERIAVYDNADILTDAEEAEVAGLFVDVYTKSGMPVTLYTDDWSWKDRYSSLEVYSEELHYSLGQDEDAATIVFTIDTDATDFVDWEYDVYCGDDTITCFSDRAFDKFLSSFHKGMANQDLTEALHYAWQSVLDDLAVTRFNFTYLIILIPIVGIFGAMFSSIISSAHKRQVMYKFFKSNPDKLTKDPISVYSVCPNCGAPNTFDKEICPYCDSSLKMR